MFLFIILGVLNLMLNAHNIKSPEFTAEQIDKHFIEPLIINIENPVVVEHILRIISDEKRSDISLYCNTLSQHLPEILVKHSENRNIIRSISQIIYILCNDILFCKQQREFYATNKEFCYCLVDIYEKLVIARVFSPRLMEITFDVGYAINSIATGTIFVPGGDEKYTSIFKELMKPVTFAKLFKVKIEKS
jgi:hypothetical protein